jgi:non-specific serine/threonine protein kinase
VAGGVLTEETLGTERLIARADQATRARGLSYFQQGRARLQSIEPTEAVFRVQGSERYEVVIWMEDGQVRLMCDCPVQGDETSPCKHEVASLVTLRNYLRLNPPVSWETVVSKAISKAPRKPGAGVTRLILGFSLQKRYSDWSVAPYSLAFSHFPSDIDPTDADALSRIIQQQRLGSQAKAIRSIGNPQRFLNLSDEMRIATQLAAMEQRYGYYSYSSDGEAGLTAVLPHLSKAVFFSGTEQNPFVKRLQVASYPAPPVLEMADTSEGLELKARVQLDGQTLALDPKTTTRLADSPLWLQAGAQIFSVDDPTGTFQIFAQTPDLLVPPEQRDAFLTRYLLPLAERITIQGLDITQEEVEAEPVPRLYLSDVEGEMQAALRFGYGDYELSYEKDLPPVSLQQKPDTLTLARIVRQSEREEGCWQDLSHYSLKRGPESGVFLLRAKTDPIDFLLHQIPKLTAAGFEVYGEEALTTARINRSKPTMSFSVSSGIDWFDVQAVARFGDLEVKIQEIRRAVRKREKFVKLGDGSLGVIPEEWLERYRHLFGMTEETDDGLRLGTGQVGLLDQLLIEGETLEADSEFEHRRERLRGFDQITPHELPQGLTGTLRPYQKAGFDWLHFLHEYEFGGCLADDMGLGKTAQALTFLQSLKEQGLAKSATLLVLPRSLIFNWEREAAKWAPGLTLLNHADTTRAKDLADFDGYDLVLTTYGILLRDIEMLSKHRFHYVILDEAQAIKNPLSQTGKAARLIKADHRLTLTGTPVENSTLELWSQFAFLNPGQLGSLEYFRTEFANAIEKHQDEASAALLRRMVHPFILRRTKDQVATDLPPRTERILYTEMEPAQRKFYEQKRDFYRAQVLGLIDKKGINDARMKILEGLLRLRQISNHPRLVEPTSKAASGKFENLLETMDTLRSEGHKALIFSQFVGMLKIIRDELDKRKIPYAYLDGSVKDRQARVDAFQGDPNLPFFLISLKAGGVGLNLTAADYVIHIDPWWNPAVEMQATDRTHRIGQTKPVFVYKLIARDTVEEKILLLQDRKRALVSQLIATEGGFFKSLTAADVASLFE